MKTTLPRRSILLLVLGLAVAPLCAPGQENTTATPATPAPVVSAPKTTLVVSKDGKGDFKTIHEAIAAIPDHSPVRITVHIRPGVYDEGQIYLPPEKTMVTFEGENADKTMLVYHWNVREPDENVVRNTLGTGVLIRANDFHASNLTFKNDSGNHGQAMALRVDADRAIFRDCKMSGWQDTLQINGGRQYYSRCFIEGRVDFIYGNAIAVFDRCEIRSRNRGHITAASTPQTQTFGFVFLNCKLTYDPTPWTDPRFPNTTDTTLPDKVDLGRPWRDYACVAFINCELGDHIKPEGWSTWVGAEQREKTARYYEYKNTGPGAAIDKRLPWTHQLTDEQAKAYTIPNILGGTDNWDPTAPETQPTAKNP